MDIIRDISSVSRRRLVATIGNFDGVHLGHQALLTQIQALATDGNAAVITFEPHPLTVLRSSKVLTRLGGVGEKCRQLAAAGVDVLYLMRFNQTLAQTSAADFAELLFARLNIGHIVVGANFRYGCGAAGDFTSLQAAAAAHGATAEAAELLQTDGMAISSGWIRRCLQEGDFATAAKLLGRAWTMSGRIRRGSGFGSRWGFPTANVHLTFTPPCHGIFAARAVVGDTDYAAAVSIGVNPTVQNDGQLRVEAHLPDYAGGDLYGRQMTLQLTHKLRDEQHFPTIDALRAAMAEDIRRVRVLTGVK